MRQESTGKPDPEHARVSDLAEPGEKGQKRSFFAAAGARLKRVIGRPEPVPSAPSEPAVAVAPGSTAGEAEEESEVSTSVQARARELLLQDRARGHRRTRSTGDAADGEASAEIESARRTSPPPLPLQRTAAVAGGGKADAATAAELVVTGVTAIPPKRAAAPATPIAAAKRRPRDSKSEALRARLGAAKAALAEAQAKRTAEPEAAAASNAEGAAAEPGLQPTDAEFQPVSDSSESRPAAEAAESGVQLPAAATTGTELATTESELTIEAADLDDADEEPEIELLYESDDELDEVQLTAAAPPLPPAADRSEEAGARSENGAEPIRTLTVARLLARQGYLERSLSIYDELIAAGGTDAKLRAEANKLRAKKRSKKNVE